MIKELISRGQQLDAVHFAYEVGLVDKFPPVPLLKAYLRDAKKTTASITEDSSNNTSRPTVSLYSITLLKVKNVVNQFNKRPCHVFFVSSISRARSNQQLERS